MDQNTEMQLLQNAWKCRMQNGGHLGVSVLADSGTLLMQMILRELLRAVIHFIFIK